MNTCCLTLSFPFQVFKTSLRWLAKTQKVLSRAIDQFVCSGLPQKHGDATWLTDSFCTFKGLIPNKFNQSHSYFQFVHKLKHAYDFFYSFSAYSTPHTHKSVTHIHHTTLCTFVDFTLFCIFSQTQLQRLKAECECVFQMRSRVCVCYGVLQGSRVSVFSRVATGVKEQGDCDGRLKNTPVRASSEVSGSQRSWPFCFEAFGSLLSQTDEL